MNVARHEAIKNLEAVDPTSVAHWVKYDSKSDKTEMHLGVFIDGKHDWKAIEDE